MARRKRQKPLKAKIAPDHPFFDIIEDAYRVFDYETPTSTDVCRHCCMYPDIEADFFNPAIHELPLHYLQDWFFAAYDPDGISKATWGYLLPRVLEALALDDEIASVGLEVSLSRFQTGDRDNWSDAEWDVLDRFQRGYLKREVMRKTEFLDDTLCMFGLAGWPLEDLLDQVAAFPDDVLARRFWNDWCMGHPSIWITAFWEGAGRTQAFNFYTSRTLFRRMEALAFAQTTDPELAEKALAVASVIEANADWVPHIKGGAAEM
jgi:hypothetical protein